MCTYAGSAYSLAKGKAVGPYRNSDYYDVTYGNVNLSRFTRKHEDSKRKLRNKDSNNSDPIHNLTYGDVYLRGKFQRYVLPKYRS